jgi:hypothetical protein
LSAYWSDATLFAMNAAWHRKHVMPKNASLEQRLAWHRGHQKACACRPIPPKLLAEMNAREGRSLVGRKA